MSDIKRIILYKHGVGYFEKRIKVRDKQSVDFFFKSREMNDVLKSFAIIDLGGGIVTSVSYDSTTPAEKLLEDVSIRIPDENSLKSLISQIKGARINILAGKDIIEGFILGLDPIVKKENETIIESSRLTILNDKGEMTSIEMNDIKTLKILDENIQKDLEFYLKTIIFSQKKDLKKLTLFATGEGERELSVSYVLESPVWKTTYRVILSEDSKPFIQGWAVVDNTQDEDWENIELSLVSGMPISFIHDLYNPRFKKRPVVNVREEEGIVPPSFEEGFAGDECLGEPCPSSDYMQEASITAERPSRASGAGPRGGTSMPFAAAPMMMDIAGSVDVKTSIRKLGDFFEYRIHNPVTIKRNQSALVPIVNQQFNAKKILIYNEQKKSSNPMNCIEMTNDTGLTLEGGPLTIYERDAYLGESMLEFVKPDEKKFIPFAVELGCYIERVETLTDESVFMIKIAGGAMQTHFYRKRESVYRIKQKNKEPVKLILEHPIEIDWELVDTVKPYETTKNYYRFLYEIPSDGEFLFAVKERKVFWNHYTLTNLSAENVEFFIGKRFIDKKVASKINELNEVFSKKQEMEREVNNRKNEIQKIYKDQERLRSNLSTLSNSREEASLKERFITKMSEQEDIIESNQKIIQNLESEIEKATKEINKMLVDFQLEVKVEA